MVRAGMKKARDLKVPRLKSSGEEIRGCDQ